MVQIFSQNSVWRARWLAEEWQQWERKRDQKKAEPTALCSVTEAVVTNAVNMAETKEGREKAGPPTVKHAEYSR